MKNIRFVMSFALTLVSKGVFTQEISKEQIAFVNQFIAYIESNDQNATLKFTDKDYRKEQLKFLEVRKEQFINELFGGVDMMTNEYVNTLYANILKVEVAEIVQQGDGLFEYIFRIRDGEHDLLKSLLLKKTKNKFGFIGSMG
ncbi:MAG: hypothetical protein QNL61_00685 [Crocinitomicaceae bacterium]